MPKLKEDHEFDFWSDDIWVLDFDVNILLDVVLIFRRRRRIRRVRFWGKRGGKLGSKTRFNSRNSCSWIRDGLDFKSETSSGGVVCTTSHSSVRFRKQNKAFTHALRVYSRGGFGGMPFRTFRVLDVALCLRSMNKIHDGNVLHISMRVSLSVCFSLL